MAKRSDRNAQIPRWGRDNMRLLEFAISSGSRQVDRKTKELVHRDTVGNLRTGMPEERTVRMVFSAKWGRPTPKDDDVLMALLRISQDEDFKSEKVFFTRAQLCRILQWPDTGRYFKDIDMAFNRITGLRIFAENLYFDKKTGLMVDRKFGIIDDAELQSRRSYLAMQRSGTAEPLSWFRWSDVMMETFADGMIKKLDLDMYRRIGNDLGRKLFRYLDMYFWRKRSHSFQLQLLTHQALGMPDLKDNFELERRIGPAIEELLQQRVIEPTSNRFEGRSSERVVHFSEGQYYRDLREEARRTKRKAKREAEEQPIVKELVSHGIDRSEARKAARRHDEKRLREDIAHMLYEGKQGRIRSSRAGLLYRLITSEEPWSRPQGLSTPEEEKAKRLKHEQIKRRAAEAEAETERAKAETSRKRYAPLWAFWETLSAAEKVKFEREAWREHAQSFHRVQLQEQSTRDPGLCDNGTIKRAYRKAAEGAKESLLDTVRELLLLEHYEAENNGSSK